MSLNDPIADMLTRIRNAVRNHAKRVEIQHSKVCEGIAQVLQSEGYIKGFEKVEGGPQAALMLDLKYGPRGEKLIHRIQRESRPGCRVYRGAENLPRPLQGLGIAIVSTSSGVLSDRVCREKRVGGELLCTVE